MTSGPTASGPTVDVDDPSALDRAVAALTAGGIVVLPTDTVYGLAARAGDDAASAQLFAAKGRRDDVPIAVLCADTSQALSLAGAITARGRALAERYWPGPLTVVVERAEGLDWKLGEPSRTIGLRCPDHAFVRALAAAVGPLATTSANRHGQPTPVSAAAAAASLLVAPDLVVDGGELAATASTVVDATGEALIVLRQGPVVVD